MHTLTASKLRYKLRISHMTNIQIYVQSRFIKCDVIVHIIMCSYGMNKVLMCPFLIVSGNILFLCRYKSVTLRCTIEDKVDADPSLGPAFEFPYV